ncbi:MAG: hypothetical protein NT113_06260, partial [Hyphomicrobiales bacterium]|nr:hypothetical protein [Hyphomicrobiales bacterium]
MTMDARPSKRAGSTTRTQAPLELPPAPARKSSREVMPSNANLGWMALDLLRRYRSTGSDGLIAICEDEHRAERLGAIIHAFEPNSGVMVLPALGPSAIEDVEASPEIAGRRS